MGINQGNAQQARQQTRQPLQQPQQISQQQQQRFQQPQQNFQQPQQNFQQLQNVPSEQQSGPNFGVFEAVSLSNRAGGPNPPESIQRSQPQANGDGFFGV